MKNSALRPVSSIVILVAMLGTSACATGSGSGSASTKPTTSAAPSKTATPASAKGCADFKDPLGGKNTVAFAPANGDVALPAPWGFANAPDCVARSTYTGPNGEQISATDVLWLDISADERAALYSELDSDSLGAGQLDQGDNSDDRHVWGTDTDTAVLSYEGGPDLPARSMYGSFQTEAG